MAAHSIAHALSAAGETEKAEFAHYLSRELQEFGLSADDATVRQVVAALDRFARPEHGRGDLG
ncbi:hypothetical protein DRW48_15425 [Paracoccus suum]|uniref:Uncharacterized protein n=1 Tax=Paracoccus suum TaxID=2259340 RepID=A0A344PNC9_9RHOB|nr:hypothetical protein [Paracoccus suum]AXC50884.1 hypothetical protein DRW48_15425 [Paracoccus suum]